MKKIIIFIILGIIVPLFAGEPVSVSANKRYLVDENGKPFFWLGDTAWELFHRLNRQEADLYLQNRADKGFTVIQAVVLAELDGLNTDNAYGEKPLFDNDPARPNEKYFKHVDYIVNKAAKLGLVIGMLPTWGDKYNKQWGAGPEIFTPENASAFGEYLAKRYKDKPIIWILGGDRNPADDEDRMITNAMAKGIRLVDKKHLITYHPTGGYKASDFYIQADWLDLDFYQSGHHIRLEPHYLISYNEKSLSQEPKRPVVNGEPNYEDHPVNWLSNGERGWFDDYDCRYAAYISLLTGACGHTYGNHNIWQMWQEGRNPISFVRTKWSRALDHPGAFQMGYMRHLYESLPWEKLVTGKYQILNPDHSSFQICTLSEDQQFLLAYTADGTELTINLNDLQSEKVTATWFNPRDGERLPVGEFATDGAQTFKPHSFGRGSDWILILK
ncbi:MAG TPA: glycoside hydrolase family 140 protein [bacterium]|nr:glycoside hydrolase family 140 protein [bacterium]HPN45571.1 glycoside hydrolase family 140 protein [bacterium]